MSTFLSVHAHYSSLKAVPALFTSWLTKNGVAVAGWLLLSIATASFPGRSFCYRSLNLPWKKLAKSCMNSNLYTLGCSEPINSKLKALSHKL